MTLLDEILEDMATAAYTVTRERTDNPPDEWITAYIAACAERLKEISALRQTVKQ